MIPSNSPKATTAHKNGAPFPIEAVSWRSKIETALSADTSPSFSWIDGGNAMQFLARLPGVLTNDLRLNIVGISLFVRGASTHTFSDSNLLKYIKHRTFSRSFRIPTNLDLNSVQATFRDEYLSLIFRKGRKLLMAAASQPSSKQIT